MTKHWIDGPAVTDSLYHHILRTRGDVANEQFLNPQWPGSLHDPFLLNDMKKATDLIWQAIASNQAIGVIGDYDMDGTPAAALMTSFFHAIQRDCTVILPTRADGYGFARPFVDRMKAAGVSLIITVDCGIRDHESVAYAKELGMAVIITDHHECAETLPPADAVLNPKRPDSHYPAAVLSGTGVAFKLVQALLASAPDRVRALVPDSWLAWTLDLVALATIADMVDLVDENRVITQYGLKVIRKGGRVGLNRFFEAIDLPRQDITYRDLAFKVIPKLNAAGRMAHMQDVFTILTSQDKTEIDAAIQAILVHNTQSQLLLGQMVDQAKRRVGPGAQSVIVLADEGWHPGLTGIVAGRLVEEFKVPVAILAGSPEGLYRGSMRSIAGVHLPDMLTDVSQHLQKFGGHSQAVGLSVEKDKFQDFEQAITSLPVVPKDKTEQMTTDGLVTASDLGLHALAQLSELEPWGMGNKEPLWSMRNIRLESPQWIGQNKSHLRATISHGMDQVGAIFFDAVEAKSLIDQPCDCYGTVSINTFRGNRSPQFQIKGLAAAQLD